MSVIVFKGGIMAADSRAYGGRGQASPGQKVKAHRLSDGTRIGMVSAIVGMPERFLAWYAQGADPKAWGDGNPDLRALIVRPNGEVMLFEDGLQASGPIVCERYAIGSGAEFALGAMEMGATAERAVEVACLFEPHCGLPVTVLGPEA
jgi:hypothetical protein